MRKSIPLFTTAGNAKCNSLCQNTVVSPKKKKVYKIPEDQATPLLGICLHCKQAILRELYNTTFLKSLFTTTKRWNNSNVYQKMNGYSPAQWLSD